MGVIFASVTVSNALTRAPQQDLVCLPRSRVRSNVSGRGFVIGGLTWRTSRKRIAGGTSALEMVPTSTDGDRLLIVFQQKTIIESAFWRAQHFLC